MIEFAVKAFVASLGVAFVSFTTLVREFEREDVFLDLMATKRAMLRERAEFNLHYAEDITEQIVHSACVETCQALDYDTDNRDGPKFAYTCIGHGHRGFTCIWENLDENLRPKRVRGVR
mgnify:CR=1 FL=1